MLTVSLAQEDWNRVLAVLSQAPWNVANPLIMQIGDQLRGQPALGRPLDGAGKPAGGREGDSRPQ